MKCDRGSYGRCAGGLVDTAVLRMILSSATVADFVTDTSRLAYF